MSSGLAANDFLKILFFVHTTQALNFFTGYHVEDGSLVDNKCLIAKKYLRGWFVIDLFSTGAC